MLTLASPGVGTLLPEYRPATDLSESVNLLMV
jgi:hypothetical protein